MSHRASVSPSKLSSTDPGSLNPYTALQPPTKNPFSTLPLDITLETLFSVGILCIAIVLGAEKLKPISWRVWAANVEKEKDIPKQVGEVGDGGYLWLENGQRRGFMDIRRLRGEFAAWAKGNT